MRYRRQYPRTCPDRADLAVDHDFDEIRLVRFDGSFDRPLDVAGTFDARAFDAVGARHHCEVGRLQRARALFRKARRELAGLEQTELQVADGTVTVVVPYDPHRGNVVFG